ncbi:hypothetical protein [Streptomyces sp. NPDC059616]|uniref:hypothetical protein n=1 Tax=Streptomyces sp. NPDC059616 TaxID=3346886 RepID=UPI0036AB1CFB
MTVALPDISTPTLTATRSIITDRLTGRIQNVPAFTATGMDHRPELSMRSFDPRQRRWSEPVRLPFGPAASSPAIAVLDGKLHLLFRPYDSEQLTWAEYQGRTWRTLPNSPGPAAPEPVALTTAGTSLICAYQTPTGQQFTGTSSNGTSWGAASAMPAPQDSAVSLCWDGTTLHAAMRVVTAGVALGHYQRDAQGEWQQDHGSFSEPPVHSPELILWNGNLTCYYRRLHGAVWTRWRHKDRPETWATQRMDDVRASNNVRLAVAGPTLYMLFPDSQGTLHLRSSNGSTWSTVVPVDEYRTLETPALAWYGDRLIANRPGRRLSSLTSQGGHGGTAPTPRRPDPPEKSAPGGSLRRLGHHRSHPETRIRRCDRALPQRRQRSRLCALLGTSSAAYDRATRPCGSTRRSARRHRGGPGLVARTQQHPMTGEVVEELDGGVDVHADVLVLGDRQLLSARPLP